MNIFKTNKNRLLQCKPILSLFYAAICCLVIAGCSSSSNSQRDDGKKAEEKAAIEIVSTESFTPENLMTTLISKLTTSRYDMATLLEKLNKLTAKTKQLGITKITSDVVKYKSIGVDSKDLELSGKIYIPNQTAKIRGIVIANHYTITSNAEAPSQTLQMEAACSLLGYVVVMSDYIGFGETKSLPQTYLGSITAKSSVDLALAAYQYLNGKYSFENTNNKVYILGYSQGGAVSLSVQKLIESQYPDKFYIAKTFAGAGPYDITATYQEMLRTGTSTISAVPALVFTGLNYSEGLNVDFSKYFQSKLYANYKDWIFSKNYTTTQLNTLIGTHDITSMLTADACNPNSTLMVPFQTAFKKNSLIDWVPKAPIYLFHSTTDDVVPEINSVNAYNSFKKNSTATIETDFSDNGGHGAAAPVFYLKVFDDIY
jgi:hypothetical protein